MGNVDKIRPKIMTKVGILLYKFYKAPYCARVFQMQLVR